MIFGSLAANSKANRLQHTVAEDVVLFGAQSFWTARSSIWSMASGFGFDWQFISLGFVMKSQDFLGPAARWNDPIPPMVQSLSYPYIRHGF